MKAEEHDSSTQTSSNKGTERILFVPSKKRLTPAVISVIIILNGQVDASNMLLSTDQRKEHDGRTP
jgi:hypothetical protein